MFEELKKQIRVVQEKEIRKDPHRIADALVYFSSWHATLTEELVDYEMAYNEKLDALLGSETTTSVSHAEVKAKTTKEYRKWQKAKALEKSLIEVIRSLKYWIRTREEEYKQS